MQYCQKKVSELSETLTQAQLTYDCDIVHTRQTEVNITKLTGELTWCRTKIASLKSNLSLETHQKLLHKQQQADNAEICKHLADNKAQLLVKFDALMHCYTDTFLSLQNLRVDHQDVPKPNSPNMLDELNHIILNKPNKFKPSVLPVREG